MSRLTEADADAGLAVADAGAGRGGADPGHTGPATADADAGLAGLDGAELTLATAADTEALGERIAARLSAGDVVLLAGPLGAGKTVLARGIGRGLGVAGAVTSPTFVIAREHPPAPGGRGVALVHVDAYRLGGRAELDDLDLDTELASAVMVVEWGEGLADRLARRYLLVRLSRQDDDSRVARLSWVSDPK